MRVRVFAWPKNPREPWKHEPCRLTDGQGELFLFYFFFPVTINDRVSAGVVARINFSWKIRFVFHVRRRSPKPNQFSRRRLVREQLDIDFNATAVGWVRTFRTVSRIFGVGGKLMSEPLDNHNKMWRRIAPCNLWNVSKNIVFLTAVTDQSQ